MKLHGEKRTQVLPRRLKKEKPLKGTGDDKTLPEEPTSENSAAWGFLVCIIIWEKSPSSPKTSNGHVGGFFTLASLKNRWSRKKAVRS